MQFNMIGSLVRKFYIINKEGLIINPSYKNELQSFLSKEEFHIFCKMLEIDNVQKAIDALQVSYTHRQNKQYVINILSQPKIDSIALILLKGSKPENLEKAIRLREQIDKNSVIFMELIQNIEPKLVTFLTSRLNKLANTNNYQTILNQREISISTITRYFGGAFERAYLDDRGVGKLYFEFLVCKVLFKAKLITPEDIQHVLLTSIWNAIPSFMTKTRFTSVGSLC